MTPTPVAPARDLLGEYRDAIARGELLVPRCQSCGRLQFPPTAVCSRCHAVDRWELAEMSGRGSIWSWVVFHKRYLSDGPETPYNVAVVALEEGPRVFARIADADAFGAGDPVRARFDDGLLVFVADDGRAEGA